MKRIAGYSLLLPALLLLAASCSELREITPADRHYLFLPEEIEPYPFTGYQRKKAWDSVDYLFMAGQDRTGFRSMYGTILVGGSGKEIGYLCLVNVLRSPDDAQRVYDRMIPEPDPREFGKTITVPPEFYGAEKTYLYVSDTGYFHLVIKAGRIVYAIGIDGATVDEAQVRRNLRAKLDFIRTSGNLFVKSHSRDPVHASTRSARTENQ